MPLGGALLSLSCYLCQNALAQRFRRALLANTAMDQALQMSGEDKMVGATTARGEVLLNFDHVIGRQLAVKIEV